MSTQPLVELENVSKAFGGVRAVEGVSFALYPGEVLGILGHNGAGKSTLIRILSGAHEADSGRILIGGVETKISNPKDAKDLGIETIYQTLALAENLDAVANLFLGREKRKFGIFNDRAAMVRDAVEICRQINPRFTNLQTTVRNLSGGQRQTIAIGRAIYFNARVLIMDEPTAALGPGETAMVKDLIAQLKKRGVGIIMISHDLEDVFELADRMMVMAGGRVVGQLKASETTHDEVLSLIISGGDGKGPRKGA